MIKRSLLLTSFLLLSTCKKETLSSSECEILSMETFRGNPKSAHQFKIQCKNVSIVNTAERCQKALNRFILTGNLEDTKNKFGKDIHLCFTQNDLKKFSKDSP